MIIKHIALGTDTAKEHHAHIVNHPNSFSLTITLNPMYNHLICGSQYRHLLREYYKIFTDWDAKFHKVMITPEITKQLNIHLHTYFILNNIEDWAELEQIIRTQLKPNSYIGKMYKLKKVDSVSSVLLNYPFKDIERTKMLGNVKKAEFHPHHTLLMPETNILVKNATVNVGGIDIKKFLEFCKLNAGKKNL